MHENFHEAIDEEESDIIPGNIVKCISWGYRIGDKVLEKAKVVVAK
ncbi:nucleotide exchange factor GrpE [Brasilonema bromeliae]|uniref:Nucleotide exchange factor GrpE n=1 Tax=Brasilonema bromeliae SPC951 TaxID=385972 RepID=A0ABX1PAH4_9CYAN|nr:nucleotide exchange factor GrpE [Brasilonema bromeliae SPC951]